MDFLESEIVEILNIFREESEEQIHKLNKNLLKLEANPKDQTAINELFREAHSLKGAARMIGLNDIQLIAHKLEDVFGSVKENHIKINPEITDILCKAVDCINSIIEESIATRGEASFDRVPAVIKELERITESDDYGEDAQNNQQEKIPDVENILPNNDKMKKFNNECKTLISQIKVSIEKVKIFSSDSGVIEEFFYFITNLNTAVEILNTSELTEFTEEIKTKLETTLKGSGILTHSEIGEIEENFDIFVAGYEKLTENLDSRQTSFSKKKEVFPETPAVIPESIPEFNEVSSVFGDPEENTISEEPEFSEEINFIKKNLASFSVHSQQNIPLFKDIIQKLNNLKKTVTESGTAEIIEKITEILIFSEEKYIPVNKDIIVILEESFENIILRLNSPVDSEFHEDTVLILQRLAVLFQMVRLSPDQNNEKVVEAETEKSPKFGDENKTEFSPVSQKTEILSKNTNIEKKDISSYEIKPGESNTIKTLRVDTKKLDRLVNQVGELIIAKIKAKDHLSELEKIIRSVEEWHREWNKTKQYFRHADRLFKPTDIPGGTSVYTQTKSIHSFFDENSARLNGLMNCMNSLYKTIQEDDARLHLIVNELEEKIKSVRVLPLATILHMFPRMVRDIAREKNKNIELLISGSETSVDKKIIEEIKSPLIHIIRNAIDHGIEEPQTRIKNGKNPAGKIFIAAYHLESSVLIEITDDGCGINLESIKNKVLAKNLLTEEELAAMTDEQIMNIIFWPGFSTGDIVTDISGRGIGLDIVYTKISQLNGQVKIKSTLGEGCKVSIQLPVTMATIKSFLVEVRGQKFAIPTSTIKTTLLATPENIFFKEGKKTIIVGDTTVPVCNLADAVDLPDSPDFDKKPGKLVIIVVQAEDVQVGFIVDKLFGDQEILHKNLSSPLLRVRNIAGITTLGSGDLCLILNINDLVKSAYSKFGISTKRLTEETYADQSIASQKHILVVDDSLTTRILERNILKAAGYKVTVADNGLEALTKIVAEYFDLIISDVEMPEINGFELTERLRELDNFKDIPVILVTSLASENDRAKGLKLGANAYMTKGDFNQEELLNTVEQLLEN